MRTTWVALVGACALAGSSDAAPSEFWDPVPGLVVPQAGGNLGTRGTVHLRAFFSPLPFTSGAPGTARVLGETPGKARVRIGDLSLEASFKAPQRSDTAQEVWRYDGGTGGRIRIAVDPVLGVLRLQAKGVDTSALGTTLGQEVPVSLELGDQVRNGMTRALVTRRKWSLSSPTGFALGDVPIRRLDLGYSDGFTHRGGEVATTEAEWRDLWDRIQRGVPRPRIDFAREMIVAETFGELPGPIAATGAHLTEDALELTVVERRKETAGPPLGTTGAYWINSVVVAVPRTDRPVVLRRSIQWLPAPGGDDPDSP